MLCFVYSFRPNTNSPLPLKQTSHSHLVPSPTYSIDSDMLGSTTRTPSFHVTGVRTTANVVGSNPKSNDNERYKDDSTTTTAEEVIYFSLWSIIKTLEDICTRVDGNERAIVNSILLMSQERINMKGYCLFVQTSFAR